MSVVPFILDGESRTVVDTQTDFDRAGGLAGKAILIQPLDKEQLTAANDSNVTYDLRVGEKYRDHRDISETTLADGQEIRLLPGMAVIIQTREFVHFPTSAFGLLVPKVRLLQLGISNTSSKIDPGYKGNLLITAFNLGKTPVPLRKGDPFCSMYVIRVLDGARPYDKGPKQILGESQTRWWRKARHFIESNDGLLSAVLILVSVALISIQIWQLWASVRK